VIVFQSKGEKKWEIRTRENERPLLVALNVGIRPFGTSELEPQTISLLVALEI